MNTNLSAWEREYQKPAFVSLGTEAAQDVKDFAKWLRRKQGVTIADTTVLDLGCGTGKNSFYFAERGAHVIGYDFSKTAIAAAQERAQTVDSELATIGGSVDFSVHSIGKPLPLENDSIDVVIDSMSSHALDAKERAVYVDELFRVLKPGGIAFIRTFVLDGDVNAKKLIKEFPASEPQTYILPETNMIEHVSTEQQLRARYQQFSVAHFEKLFGYQRWGKQSYKRRYAVIYLQKTK